MEITSLFNQHLPVTMETLWSSHICKAESMEAPRSSVFSAEWQTSHEKLSFQRGQIRSWIFAETKLPPAGFFTLLQVRTQLAPAKIVAGSEFLSCEDVLIGNDSRDDANRTKDHHARNGSASARRSSVIDAFQS